MTYVPSGRSALVAAEAEDRDMAKCDRMPISWHSISSGVIDIHV